MTGSVQTLVVCNEMPGAESSGVCGPGFVQATVQAYVFDATQATAVEAAMEPVDAATASTVFFAAFSAVVMCFFVSRVVGSVLNMIRQ